MEVAALLLFCAGLIVCVAAGASVVLALIFGYLVFGACALKKGYSPRQVLKMSWEGALTAKGVIITMLLIGALTALWRCAGTIPAIVYYTVRLIRPGVFLPMVFLLNCLVSFLTGTSFGTAAILGVVCMTLARTMGVSPVLLGGAVLAGAYFGDRCSPVSSSALLVSELTGTDLFRNIRRMVRSAAVPFALSCAVYAAAGLTLSGDSGGVEEVRALLSAHFSLGLATLLPAALILLLSAFRVKVQRAMLVSIAAAAVVCAACQGMGLPEILRAVVLGYQAGDPQMSAMLDGGGIVSMVRVVAIVGLSSCYSGIFKATGLLEPLKRRLRSLLERTSPRITLCLTAVITNMISCNQTLAIILTHQLCGELWEDPEELALDLEDFVVVIAPLIPWSISGGVPLASVAAPTTAILAACYLYLLPLWRLVTERAARRVRVS